MAEQVLYFAALYFFCCSLFLEFLDDLFGRFFAVLFDFVAVVEACFVSTFGFAKSGSSFPNQP